MGREMLDPLDEIALRTFQRFLEDTYARELGTMPHDEFLAKWTPYIKGEVIKVDPNDEQWWPRGES
jgi:hypothetical protein